jgi:hypothetical protein
VPARPFYNYLVAHRDEYAGEWIDQQRDGLVTVLFTGHVPDHARALAGLFPFSGHLEVRAAASRYDQLVDWSGRVSRDLNHLRTLGVAVVRVGPDVRTNAITVAVSGNVAEAERRLQATYPSYPIEVVA